MTVGVVLVANRPRNVGEGCWDDTVAAEKWLNHAVSGCIAGWIAPRRSPVRVRLAPHRKALETGPFKLSGHALGEHGGNRPPRLRDGGQKSMDRDLSASIRPLRGFCPARCRTSASFPARLRVSVAGLRAQLSSTAHRQPPSMNNKGEGESDHRDSKRSVVLADSSRVDDPDREPNQAARDRPPQHEREAFLAPRGRHLRPPGQSRKLHILNLARRRPSAAFALARELFGGEGNP
jgi:hypothetical protein